MTGDESEGTRPGPKHPRMWLAGFVTVIAGLVVGAMCWPQDGTTPQASPTPTRAAASGPNLGPASYTIGDLGVTLAYVRQDATGVGTLVIATPDGKVADVGEAHGVFTGVAWAPDGASIAVSFGPSANVQDVYVLSASDGSLKRVTNDGHSRRPTWSPDGQTIAFSNATDGSQGHGPVVKSAASGGPATPVSPNAQNDNPAWAPDGSSIAVSREAGSTVLISPETGADLRRIDWLRDSAPTYSSFVWSSDGSALAGVIRKGTDLAVVVLGDGLTSQRQIGAPFLGNPTDPASIHPSFVPGFPKLIAASDKTGDLVLLDLQAEPTDQPSRAPYSPIQVLIPAPKGGKLAFPAVRTPRPTGQPGSVVSFVGAGSGR